MDDDYLYHGIKNKDDHVLAEAFIYYEPLFYKIGREILLPSGSDEDIAECISEAWYYIWEHIDDFQYGKYTFKSWCILIFKSRAINRKAGILKNIKNQRELGVKDNNDTAELVIRRENYSELLKEMDGLKPPKAEIFYKRYIKGRTPKEIAGELNMPVKKIYYHLNCGKKLLRRQLEDRAK